MDSFSIKRSPLVLLLLLAGIGARLYAAFYFGGEPSSEREALFTALAAELKTTFQYGLDGHPTAVAMPIYPALLALFRFANDTTWLPVLVFQGILGGLGAWLAHRIAWRITRISTIAWTTLLLALFYPPLILQASRLEPETLYGFLLALGTWILSFVLVGSTSLAHFILTAGLFMGGIYLTPKILPLVPFLAVWASIKSHDRILGFLGGASLCLACVLCLMPWMARNFLSVGGFIPLTTGFVQPLQKSLSDAGAPLPEAPPSLSGQDETIRYQAGAHSVFTQVKNSGFKVWMRILMRGFPFWMTHYPGLLPATAGEPAALESSFIYRAVFLTVTVLFFILALAGVAAGFFNLNAWMLMIFLFISTCIDVLMGSPAYYHLAYLPFYLIFVSWGAWALFGWALIPMLKARRENSFDSYYSASVEEEPEPIEPVILTEKEKNIPPLDSAEKDSPPPLGPIFRD